MTIVKEPPAPATLPADDGDRRTLAGRRVLIVDDNHDAAEILAEAVTMMGHDTRRAHDGAAALSLAANFLPEVALLDIGLPMMDGYELARRMRKVPGLAGVKLVALTGYGQDRDRRRSLEAGFDEHLLKPVDLEGIRALIEGREPDGAAE